MAVTAGYISPLPGAAFTALRQRRISLLGATGSIGSSTLEVVRASQGSLVPVALAGGDNIALLARLAEEFRPRYLGVRQPESIARLEGLLAHLRHGDNGGYAPLVLAGQEGYMRLATLPEADCVVSAQSGAAGLQATVAACRAGKVVALANKESLVIAGTLIRTLCHEHGASILPVDSEHNAIFQCLAGSHIEEVQRILLTASGGPFFGKPAAELACITPAMALKHPNWDMGAKITIDSATLMNKGLEVIEACHLYGLPLEAVTVVVHRQSLVHSLVAYVDGSVLAQLSVPDMRTAIGHCLHWPNRQNAGVPPLDLMASPSLTFEPPDEDTFPCLRLAKQAYKSGGGLPAVMNAANEVAVAAFLQEKLPFSGIPRLVEKTMISVALELEPLSLESLLSIDQQARTVAESFVEHFQDKKAQ